MARKGTKRATFISLLLLVSNNEQGVRSLVFAFVGITKQKKKRVSFVDFTVPGSREIFQITKFVNATKKFQCKAFYIPLVVMS